MAGLQPLTVREFFILIFDPYAFYVGIGSWTHILVESVFFIFYLHNYSLI